MHECCQREIDEDERPNQYSILERLMRMKGLAFEDHNIQASKTVSNCQIAPDLVIQKSVYNYTCTGAGLFTVSRKGAQTKPSVPGKREESKELSLA